MPRKDCGDKTGPRGCIRGRSVLGAHRMSEGNAVMPMRLVLPVLLGLGLATSGRAEPIGAANVIDVVVIREPGGTFRFDVTIQSDDTGWDAYADAFEIVAPDGTVLGRRMLLHPHEAEQPFTRSLEGVVVPPHVAQVTVRAHHLDEGYVGRTREAPVPR